jgi:nucleoside-diphosphate-sugar epimerase
MKTVITGANGFVGKALTQRLLGELKGNDQLVLVDTRFDHRSDDLRLKYVPLSIAEQGVWKTVIDRDVTHVVHLASIPGGSAERNHGLARKVNLDASLDLLDRLRHFERFPRLVFASTIAVYGAPLPSVVDESTPLLPALSYGAQKLMTEVSVTDYARRNWVDGISLRLPGIVARPPEPSGLLSAFMSEVFWALSAGREFTCPVSADAIAWWMSVECCVDNLLHALYMDTTEMGMKRAFPLPVLHLRMIDVVDGLCKRFGESARELVAYRPNPSLEEVFGRYPPLNAQWAEQWGFKSDKSIDALIERVLSQKTR